ncbi:MAG TPA: lactonase family protein [Flavisolibacter sp.]|nr:lactonase family protein [Flavisolibacter sp.]
MKRILSIAMITLALQTSAQHNYLLTGTYTKGTSKGIYVYDFSSKDGSSAPVDSVVSSNPSYLAVSPDQRFVYAVSETGNGMVRAFAFNNGRLTLLNEQPSNGDSPCYITVDKTGKWVIVGNYSSGSVAVLPVQEGGGLGKAVSVVQHSGKGPNAKRQEGPHVHATVLSPDNRYLFVPDLGIDKLMIYAFDEQTGKLEPAAQPSVQLEPGSGPRHFDFHPNRQFAYLLQELSGKITAFSYANGKLSPVQTISLLPEGFDRSFTSADVHVSPDGRFLYASNRDASNTIAIFSIDRKTGKLSLAGHQSTLGQTPRNFNFDPSGNFLLVANQNSDEIVVFRIDRKTGLLSDSKKRIALGSPVCVKWIKK